MKITKIDGQADSYQLSGRWPTSLDRWASLMNALLALLPGLELGGSDKLTELHQRAATRYSRHTRHIADLDLSSGVLTIHRQSLVPVFDRIAAKDSYVPLAVLELQAHEPLASRRCCPWPPPSAVEHDLTKLEGTLLTLPSSPQISEAYLSYGSGSPDDDYLEVQLHFNPALRPDGEVSVPTRSQGKVSIVPQFITAMAERWVAKLDVVVQPREGYKCYLDEQDGVFNVGDTITEIHFCWGEVED